MAGIRIKATDFIAKRKMIRKSQRYIGIEIEGGLKPGTKIKNLEQIIEAPIGLEGRVKEQKIMRYAGYDGTGIEYSILPTQVEIWLTDNQTLDKIEYRFNKIAKQLKPERGNGVHIHYSLRPEDPKDLPMRALWFNRHAQSILEKVSGRSTHWADAPTFLEQNYDKFKERKNLWQNSKAVQLTYKSDFKTLEWRGPKSTDNFQQIKAWVRFYCDLMEYLRSPEWKDIPVQAIMNSSLSSIMYEQQTTLNSKERATIITKKGATI